MDTVIAVSGLVKNFGSVRALNGLDLRVTAGQVHGFLGPNGAGKSTTIRILLGLASHQAGTVEVFGLDPWKNTAQIHQRVAYVPPDVSLWPNLSGGEIIDLLTRMRGGISDVEAYRKRRERLIEVFQLDPSRKARAYSSGNRQKVALICAFATAAQLYVFDEPTSGLDPLMEAMFHNEIERVVREEGATVLLPSHILSEVERLCDQVTIIRSGQTIETGTLQQLQQLTRTSVSFMYREGVDQRLRAIDGVHEGNLTHGKIYFSVDSDVLSAVLSQLAVEQVNGLVIAPPSLEELFLRHYSDPDAAYGQQNQNGSALSVSDENRS